MSDQASRPSRSAEAIDQDFADLMASKMPGPAARDKFETLWDEANAIAAQTVHMIEGQQYIALLKRMHETFEDHYPTENAVNGHVKRRSQRFSAALHFRFLAHCSPSRLNFTRS